MVAPISRRSSETWKVIELCSATNPGRWATMMDGFLCSLLFLVSLKWWHESNRHEKQSMKARAWKPETKEWYMVSPCCLICWTWLQSFSTFALLRANRNRLNSRLSSPLQAWSWLQIRKKGVASNSILESLNALVDVTLGFRLAQSSSCEKKRKYCYRCWMHAWGLKQWDCGSKWQLGILEWRTGFFLDRCYWVFLKRRRFLTEICCIWDLTKSSREVSDIRFQLFSSGGINEAPALEASYFQHSMLFLNLWQRQGVNDPSNSSEELELGHNKLQGLEGPWTEPMKGFFGRAVVRSARCYRWFFVFLYLQDSTLFLTIKSVQVPLLCGSFSLSRLCWWFCFVVPSPFICFGHWLKRGQRRKTQVIDLGAYVAGGQLEVWWNKPFCLMLHNDFPNPFHRNVLSNTLETAKRQRKQRSFSRPYAWVTCHTLEQCRVCIGDAPDGCNLSLHSLVSYTLMFEFLSPESQVGVKFQDHLFAVATHFWYFAVFWSNQQGPILSGLKTGSRACSAPHKDGCVHQGAGVWSAEGWRIVTLNVTLLGDYGNCTWRSLPWIEYILKLQELGSKVSLWIWNCTRKNQGTRFYYHHSLPSSVNSFFSFPMHFFLWTCATFCFESAAICTSFHLLGPGAQA